MHTDGDTKSLTSRNSLRAEHAVCPRRCSDQLHSSLRACMVHIDGNAEFLRSCNINCVLSMLCIPGVALTNVTAVVKDSAGSLSFSDSAPVPDR